MGGLYFCDDRSYFIEKSAVTSIEAVHRRVDAVGEQVGH